MLDRSSQTGRAPAQSAGAVSGPIFPDRKNEPCRPKEPVRGSGASGSFEQRDDSRLEDRSRALRRNARDVRRPRGPAARIARAVRAIFARDEIVAIYAVCNR
jgi:hypothetical protein